MLRNVILLLVFSSGLHVGSPYAASPYAGSPYATAHEIKSLNESQSTFNLGGSRISVEIRDRVLRGILEDGYSMQASATAMQIFESADRAIGVTVLVPLYQKMKADPFPVDLDKLWQELGVGYENDAIVYDDDAPLAHIRKAMLRS